MFKKRAAYRLETNAGQKFSTNLEEISNKRFDFHCFLKEIYLKFVLLKYLFCYIYNFKMLHYFIYLF